MKLGLESVLAAEAARLLLQLGNAAADYGLNSYLVGGAVRDALLRIETCDIDVMLEGDATAFGPYLRKNWSRYLPDFAAPERLVIFSRYGTVKVPLLRPVAGGITTIDLSSARSEQYPEPGRPPLISRGDLHSDLIRRDFSINALALDLHPARVGTLLDFCHGLEHLERKEVNILHEASFLDDPARLIRAVRMTERFDFHFGDATAAAFSSAVKAGNLSLLPRTRLFDEFRKALSEKDALPIVKQLSVSGLLAQIHPALMFDQGTSAVYEQLKLFGSEAAEPWQLLLLALARAEDRSEFHGLIAGFGLRRGVANLLEELWDKSRSIYGAGG